jgi:hypothetical protein
MNGDIKNVLKYHQLQDLIPNIENMVYREEKKKLKIHAAIKEEVVLISAMVVMQNF